MTNSTTTTNYGLTKPEGAEVFNVNVFNNNSDIIDVKMYERCRRHPNPPGYTEGTLGDIWVDTMNNKIWQCTGNSVWAVVAAGGGGGSNVSWIPVLTSGTVIGKLMIDGVENLLYCTSGGATGDFLPRDGSKPMAGNINMADYKITNLATPTEETDATRKKYVDDRVIPLIAGSSTTDVRYLQIGGTEYRLLSAANGTMLRRCETGTLTANCPSRTGYLNVLGYFASVYVDNVNNKVIVNGVVHNLGEEFKVGTHSVTIGFTHPTFTIICPIGTTFLQDQTTEDSLGITGAITTFVKDNATPNRVICSNANGKLDSSLVSTTALEYIKNLRADVQAQIDTIPHGVEVNLNGTDVATKATFYAPIVSGTAGLFLKSDGNGKAPVWDVPPTNKIHLNGNEIPYGQDIHFYAPTITCSDRSAILASDGSGGAPRWANMFQFELDCAGHMIEGTVATLKSNYGNVSILDSMDFLIIRCTDNSAPGRIWDEIIYHPKDYAARYWCKRWTRDGDDMYAELYFNYNGGAIQDMVTMTHSVRVEIVKIIGFKLGPIDI